MTTDTKTKIRYFSIALFITGLLVAGALYFSHEPPFQGIEISSELILKAPKDKILKSEEVDWIIQKEDGTYENKGKIISYDYISDVEVPVEKDEDITQRTGNAKFIKKEVKDGEQVYQAKIYSGTPFVKTDKWYQTETATTSIEAFEEQTKVSWIDKLFNIAQAESLTPVYSGAGDGRMYLIGSSNWDTTHDTTTATAANPTANTMDFQSAWEGGVFVITRTFVPIDATAMPDDAVISAVSLFVNVTGTNDADNDAQGYVALIGETSQASFTTLATTDFDNCGAVDNPTKASADIDLTGLSTGSLEMAFTQAGIDMIEIVTGYSKFGLREGHDIEDVAIVGSDPSKNYATVSSSEATGTANDPYLTITYTIGGVTPPAPTYIQTWIE